MNYGSLNRHGVDDVGDQLGSVKLGSEKLEDGPVVSRKNSVTPIAAPHYIHLALQCWLSNLRWKKRYFECRSVATSWRLTVANGSAKRGRECPVPSLPRGARTDCANAVAAHCSRRHRGGRVALRGDRNAGAEQEVKRGPKSKIWRPCVTNPIVNFHNGL